jgi:Family of unknown function (DUF6152)
MRDKIKASVLVAVGLLVVSVPLFAHHGNAAYIKRQVTITGTVTAWLWVNPHSLLKVDVPDGKGGVIHWICENNAPPTLINYGFTAKTFKPGDKVTVVMDYIAKSAPVGRVAWVKLANGQILMARNGPPKSQYTPNKPQ